jgi:trigger factor
MQVNVEQLSSVKKKLNFEISVDRVKAETQKAFAELRKRAVVPGFRKGKAPEGMIRQQYQGQVQSDVMKNLFNDCYFKYVQDNKIFPLGYPQSDAEEFVEGAPFKFSAVIEVFPEVKADNYEGFNLVREKFVADENAVAARLEQMRDNMSHLEPLAEERPAQNGDQVIIDFEGYVDGALLDGGSATDHALELGSNSFIPGFEEQVAGMKVGDKKRIALAFPEQYHSAELSGKPVEFEVTLKEIKVKVVPELDDELAKDFGDFENLADLKAKVAENIEKQEKERIDRDFKDSLVKQLIEKNDFEVPETMIERQLNSMLENAKQRLQYQRMTLEMMGLSEESYKQQFRAVAADQVKGALLLHEIAQKAGVTVAESDVDSKLRQVAEETGQDFDRISNYYKQNKDARSGLEEQIKEEKVIELITAKAQVVEKERKDMAAE